MSLMSRRPNPAPPIGFVIGVIFLAALPARGESVEEFYRGRTITMYVGTGVGAGAVSAYPLALAPVIKKYIPGNPSFIVQNMPGAGGLKAVEYLYRIAPKDGSVIGTIGRGLAFEPMLGKDEARFDPLRFTWLGGMRILDCVERDRVHVLQRRPTLGLADVPRLAWRALAWTRHSRRAHERTNG